MNINADEISCHFLIDKKDIEPSKADYEIITHRIEKYLTDEDKLNIFMTFIYNNKKIYTMTEDNVLFDLVDLEYNIFWNIYYHISLLLNNNEHKDIIEKAQSDNIINNIDYNNDIYNKLENMKKNTINDNNINSEYYELMMDAFK